MEKLPTPAELVPAVIKALDELGGKAHFKDIERVVAKQLNLSPSTLQVIRSGKRTEFAYRLSWARTSAKSQNLIKNEGKGIWSKI
jgi:restriction endonuclease Mrr